VSHSVSPEIHGAAYFSLGIDATYDLLDCPDEAAVRTVVAKVREGELRGVNVTVPHKQLALSLADEIETSASKIGAANVLSSEGGRVVAYNTDAWALGRELDAEREKASFPRGGAALVLGGGGAALAAVVSCEMAGYEKVFVSARRFSGDERSSWPGAEELGRVGAELLSWDECFDGRISFAAIVQATSAGMKGKSGGNELADHVPFARLPRLLAYDLVYNPPKTPFLERAEENGHASAGGLGMLVLQAARSVEIWTGRFPSTEPMFAAARAVLGLTPDVDGTP
jgi:shikimate dehydrogenase